MTEKLCRQSRTRMETNDLFGNDDGTLIIEKAVCAGVRLDVFCGEILERETGGTRSAAKKLIDDGRVTVNGKVAKANMKMREGDTVCIDLPAPEPIDAEPENIPIDIVYEDSSIAVINKAKGMVVHPAPGNSRGTLVNALMYHIKDLSGIGGVVRPGIVHRIDKLTSGLLVIAKNDAAHISLSEQIKAHTARRTYLSLVCGNIKDDAGTIDVAVGRHPTDRKKMACIRPGVSGTYRDAVTHFRVLERFGSYTLTEEVLETGRTHQIRVHMAHIKHPLVGDDVYGSGKNPFGIEGQALHAVRLELCHPETHENMAFYAPLPDWFSAALLKLGSGFDSSIYGEDALKGTTGILL